MTPTKTEKVLCPMCAGDVAKVVRNRADIVQCECGLVYLRTRPNSEQLQATYDKYADGPSHMRLPTTVAELAGTGLRREYFLEDVIAISGSPRGALLDIGCGWGAFLLAARDRGYRAEGVEICGKAAGFAKRVLGIPVHGCQLEAATYGEAPFRVVTALHSLEHLPHLRGALEHIHALLEPDGFFCGIVPNFGSFCSQAMGDRWEWLDEVMHYQHFTPESIAKALWSCGFNLHRVYTATGDFNRAALAKAAGTASIDALEKANRGEEIRFFAQKI